MLPMMLAMRGRRGASGGSRFAATLYDGVGSAQLIATGSAVGGAGGGLIWLRRRDASGGAFVDTESGVSSILSFDPNGFLLSGMQQNVALANYVAWSFAQQSGFFKVMRINFTPGGSYAHGFGANPGLVMVPGVGQIWHQLGGKIDFNGTPQGFANGISADATDLHWGSGMPFGTYSVYIFGADDERSCIGTFDGTLDVDDAFGFQTVDLTIAPSWALLLKTTMGDHTFVTSTRIADVRRLYPMKLSSGAEDVALGGSPGTDNAVRIIDDTLVLGNNFGGSPGFTNGPGFPLLGETTYYLAVK